LKSAKKEQNNMVEILVVTYLVLGLIATVLIWAALIASKRDTDEAQEMTNKSFATDRFFKSNTTEIEPHS
jgi:cytoskeletal protein RodZ